MKTVTLRTLVREPAKVKKLTNAGFSVQVTDNGVPLWIIQGINDPAAEAERIRATDEALDEVLRGRVSKISLAKIIDESRR
jgi:hypothetical protein